MQTIQKYVDQFKKSETNRAAATHTIMLNLG